MKAIAVTIGLAGLVLVIGGLVATYINPQNISVMMPIGGVMCFAGVALNR